MTYNQWVNLFGQFAMANQFIKGFYHGHNSLRHFQKDIEYPFMHLMYMSSSYTLQEETVVFEVLFMDLPVKKHFELEMETEILSDMKQAAEDLIAEIRNGMTFFQFTDKITIVDSRINPLVDKEQHVITGVSLDLTLEVPYTADACFAPFEGSLITGGCPTLADLWQPINVENSIGCLLHNDITSPTTTITIPNINVQDINGVNFGAFPTPLAIKVNSDLQLVKMDGCNIHITPICHPVTIEINGNIEGTVASGDTAQILLEDNIGNPVTPDSVTKVNDVFTIVVPSSSITNIIPSRLTLPFSDVIHNVGDLGWQWANGTFDHNDPAGIPQELDPAAGANYWYTLKHANSFGNNLRFTDDQGIGGATGRYDFGGNTVTPNSPGATPAYYIDHLTGNGWVQFPLTMSKNYLDSLNACNNFVLGIYSDFRMPNETEYLSIAYDLTMITTGTLTIPNTPFVRGSGGLNFDSVPGGPITTAWLNRRTLPTVARVLQSLLRISNITDTIFKNHGTFAVRKHF